VTHSRPRVDAPATDDSFTEFFSASCQRVVGLVALVTGEVAGAEDATQEAFARAYASWGRVRRAGNPDAYVRRIVINEHRSRFRKHRVAEELRADLATEPMGGQQQGPEEQQALLDALRSLGPRQRAVVVLRYWLDLSEAETAAALNCSVGTVKSQASRALATLRRNATAPGDERGADIVEGGLR